VAKTQRVAQEWQAQLAQGISEAEADAEAEALEGAEGEAQNGAPEVGDKPADLTELLALSEGVLQSFAAAVRAGDIVGASRLVAPCLEILAPGRPRYVSLRLPCPHQGS